MNYAENQFTQFLHKHPYQECVRCVMNTSDPWISFNDEGVCNHCEAFDRHEERMGPAEDRLAALENMTNDLKKRGRGRDYDCIMGLSGGG